MKLSEILEAKKRKKKKRKSAYYWGGWWPFNHNADEPEPNPAGEPGVVAEEGENK